jgi:hypothetical protein
MNEEKSLNFIEEIIEEYKISLSEIDEGTDAG